MKAIVCNIYDKVAKTYTAPLTFTNDDCAIRYFKQNASQFGTIGDYKVNKIGVYDDETGVFSPVEISILFDGDSYGKDEQ